MDSIPLCMLSSSHGGTAGWNHPECTFRPPVNLIFCRFCTKRQFSGGSVDEEEILHGGGICLRHCGARTRYGVDGEGRLWDVDGGRPGLSGPSEGIAVSGLVLVRDGRILPPGSADHRPGACDAPLQPKISVLLRHRIHIRHRAGFDDRPGGHGPR